MAGRCDAGAAAQNELVNGVLGRLSDVARMNHSKQLKMTKQEVKDEYKDTEGKPEVKRRIKETQIAMAQRRMMAEVPKADVIITNPTHYAVALKYDAKTMAAPVVVAKGADFIAAEIRRIALESNVPLMSSPALARSTICRAASRSLSSGARR